MPGTVDKEVNRCWTALRMHFTRSAGNDSMHATVL